VPLGPSRDHLPAAAHPQVAAQDEPAFEPEQQVLSDRFDRLQPPSVERRRREGRGRARVRRLDRDALPDEHLQLASGAVQRVAFGHGALP
jgi:hypothetical protein